MVIAFLSLREFLQKLYLLLCHKIAKCRFANGTQSNGLNRIFANKGNYAKEFGATFSLPQAVLISSIKPISSSISIIILHAAFFDV